MFGHYLIWFWKNHLYIFLICLPSQKESNISAKVHRWCRPVTPLINWNSIWDVNSFSYEFEDFRFKSVWRCHIILELKIVILRKSFVNSNVNRSADDKQNNLTEISNIVTLTQPIFPYNTFMQWMCDWYKQQTVV